PVLRLPANVRKAEVVERLGLSLATLLSVAAGEPSELDEPRLVGVQFQTELCESLAKVGEEPLRIALMLEPSHKVSGRGESHPPALSEPDVNLSTHPAPIIQPHGTSPSRQWAKRALALPATACSHRRARLACRCSPLYFRMAQRTR